MAEPVYRRVVIKLSGEYLAGSQSFGIDQPTVDRIADDLIAARQLGVEVAVVVGGGNIVRGVEVSSRGVSRPTGDTMGMLATMMNCLALEAAIERKGTPARTLSAFVMPEISELFTRSATHKYLAEGRIVLLGGGTGNPFFTTDTTAVLRAAEIGAQAVLKATNVDGVYSADQALRPPDPFAGHRRRLQGDGRDRIRACPRDVAAYHRILDRRAGFDRRDAARYRPWHGCRRLTGRCRIEPRA
jgi:uridylate kinase